MIKAFFEMWNNMLGIKPKEEPKPQATRRQEPPKLAELKIPESLKSVEVKKVPEVAQPKKPETPEELLLRQYIEQYREGKDLLVIPEEWKMKAAVLGFKGKKIFMEVRTPSIVRTW